MIPFVRMESKVANRGGFSYGQQLALENVPDGAADTSGSSLEERFDPTFATRLALREKQIQQNYRPIIGIHKWFARRPGTVFRSLLIAEYNNSEPLETSYWRKHKMTGVIADPFMGGGTPIYEANRLGFSVLGADTNPMAFWIVRQALGRLDIQGFASAAEEVASAIEDVLGTLYETSCVKCGQTAQVKYFIWVKTERCPLCEAVNDLFPGYLLSQNSRHPKHVVVCSECGCLNECDEEPSKDAPIPCAECNGPVYTEGPARRQRVPCRRCGSEYPCVKCGQTAQVKYFIWVKTERCPLCEAVNDLFPGYLLSQNSRHPKHVVVCSECGCLNECDEEPSKDAPIPCAECNGPVYTEGPARRQRVPCRRCGSEYPYPTKDSGHPPAHRMWAMEYHCKECKPTHKGRFFKRPDADDLDRYEQARLRLLETSGLPIPDDEIPRGDETDRLHRWGYRRYREMFTERQLLGLGLLLRRISQVSNPPVRHALLTVFSDFLRYQNMLCRYDAYALKCQDIFSVHGFPVGLVQCENNLLGIPKVGSGSFRHFVEKYRRAKEYCEAPFETQMDGKRKKVVPIPGERIRAEIVRHFPIEDERQAQIAALPATAMPLAPGSLDGVFTDPPYFANVQYAELIDFNYVWLRQALQEEFPEFRPSTTRSPDELTGNVTLGRGIEHFTEGLSTVFRHYAAALKPGAPFVFTYHHNDPSAYVAVVVAILDAGLDCTATLPAAAEMSASLHILGTKSSILDSIFVCRRVNTAHQARVDIRELLEQDAALMAAAEVKVSQGDIRCLASGHIARVAINELRGEWDSGAALSNRMGRAEERLVELARDLDLDSLPRRVLESLTHDRGLMRRSGATSI